MLDEQTKSRPQILCFLFFGHQKNVITENIASTRLEKLRLSEKTQLKHHMDFYTNRNSNFHAVLFGDRKNNDVELFTIFSSFQITVQPFFC